MSNSENKYLPYFQPLNGDGIKNIFNSWHIRKMKEVEISVNEDDDTQEMNLGNYISVCKFNKLIKKCIEGYGYNSNSSYDHLEGDERDEFLKTLQSLSPNGIIEDVPEKFRQYINVDNVIDRNFRMPPMSIPTGAYRARPLTHEAITAFNDWVDNGMRENEEGEPYQGVIFTK